MDEQKKEVVMNLYRLARTDINTAENYFGDLKTEDNALYYLLLSIAQSNLAICQFLMNGFNVEINLEEDEEDD